MRKLTENDVTPESVGCRCRQAPCLLDGRCEVKDIIYKATIEGPPNEKFFYYGSCSTRFITRYHNHKHSFKFRNSKTSTALSRKVWDLKDKGVSPKVTFKIHKESKSAGTCETSCRLCIDEKKCILYDSDPNMINSREEIYSKCKHRYKWKLARINI